NRQPDELRREGRYVELRHRRSPSRRSSKDKEDREGNGKAEEAGRLGQREAEKRKGLHLPLRRRVAGDRADQCRKHIADTDTGPHEGNARKAGSDHFGGSEIHLIFRKFRGKEGVSVEVDSVAEIEAGEDG